MSTTRQTIDFTAFSDENFDVNDWVNSVLSESAEASSNSSGNHASQLAMKLQLFIQEVNKSLEETCLEVMQNLPRVVRDAESIRHEMMTLQSEMRAVKDDVAKVEHDTAQSMQMLLTIDGLKSRMQGACKALQEADNWTTLSADVEEVFQSGDFNAIAFKLQGMQQSLKILVDIPDYKDRCQHLENLKNRLETSLGPHLIAAINTNSVDSAQIYVRIFGDIERLGEVQKYYHKCTKAKLLQSWRETVESDQDYTLINWLSLYFDMLLSHWHTQMKWCSQVFPNLLAVEVLCNLVSDTLRSLDPPLSALLGSSFKQQTDDPLTFLIDVKQVVERFYRSLGAAIKLHSPSSLDADYVKSLASAINSPLKIYVLKYASYEEKRLLSRLDKIAFGTTSEDGSESIRLLSDSVVKVFALADEANNNCQQLTGGCGYQSLAKAMNAFLDAYVSKVRTAIIRWKDGISVGDNLIDSANDWSFLQCVLQAVQICGDILLRTNALDQTLVSLFLNSAAKLGFAKNNDESKDIITLDAVCLESHERLSLEKLSIKLTDGENASFLQDVRRSEVNLCKTVGRIAFDVFFSEIQRQLSSLPSMKTWSLENPSGVLTDLPTFGVAPQEYITQIGQYLMTAVQHIEPFTLQDNPALRSALKHGKLPYSKHLDRINADHIADYLLGCIAAGTCETYVETIFKVPQVTQYARQQLATDIDYLCNVLDDLGLHPSDNLMSVAALLKASREDYAKVAEGKPARLVSAIRGLRNLTLVDGIVCLTAGCGSMAALMTERFVWTVRPMFRVLGGNYFQRGLKSLVDKDQHGNSCRGLKYVQGQSCPPNLREYFYYVDHQGMLFLDDARMKNFTSCFKDKIFLEFFFKRLTANRTDRYADEFPFVSPCGIEKNYVRCDDTPIVYTHVFQATDGEDRLSYAHAGDLLTVTFRPASLYMRPNSGRVYHPASESVGGIGLVKSSLGFEFSKLFVFDDGEGRPPTRFTWKNRVHDLTNELAVEL